MKDPGDERSCVYRPFHPQELATIYLGCRMPSENRESIIAAVAKWETPISFFEMKDERIRFELTAHQIS
jgi:hypothetical protein